MPINRNVFCRIWFFSYTLMFVALVIVIGGCGGDEINTKPDSVKTDGSKGDARFSQSQSSKLGFDDVALKGYQAKGQPYDSGAWPYKAVQLNSQDPIHCSIKQYEPSSVTFRGRNEASIALPDESIPADAAECERVVRGLKLSTYTEGYAMDKTRHIQGFAAKVYNRKTIAIGLVKINLPGGAPYDAPAVAGWGKKMDEIYNQAVVTVNAIDLGAVTIAYDLDGNGSMGVSSTPAPGRSEPFAIANAIRAMPTFALVDKVCCYVASIDTFPAGIRITGISDMCFLMPSVRGPAWEPRNSAHELGHIYGLDEFENAVKFGTVSIWNEYDDENLMWSRQFGNQPQEHLRFWQWDVIQANIQ